MAKLENLKTYIISTLSKHQNNIQYIVTKNNCWNCISHSKNSTKYPTISVTKEGQKLQLTVARFVYLGYNGPIPDSVHVLHKCDNIACINPNHLFIGTHQDNMTDKVNKNRQAKGADVKKSNLTDNDVIFIRYNHNPNGLSLTRIKLASMFKVSHRTICHIINKNTWRHV